MNYDRDGGKDPLSDTKRLNITADGKNQGSGGGG